MNMEPIQQSNNVMELVITLHVEQPQAQSHSLRRTTVYRKNLTYIQVCRQVIHLFKASLWSWGRFTSVSSERWNEKSKSQTQHRAKTAKALKDKTRRKEVNHVKFDAMTHQLLSVQLDFKSQIWITSRATRRIAVVLTMKLPDKSTKAWKGHHGATPLYF